MAALVPNPTGADLAAELKRANDINFANGTAALAVAGAREAAAAFTRYAGFEDETKIPRSLRRTIINRAIRMVGNVEQLLSESRDGVSMNYGLAAQGFTLEEQRALNEYRRTAASI